MEQFSLDNMNDRELNENVNDEHSEQTCHSNNGFHGQITTSMWVDYSIK